MKRLLLTLSLMLGSIWLLAQSSSQCARALSEAEIAFEQGRLSDIIGAFEDDNTNFTRCLDFGVFSIDEEIRAYKLLTKAYLFQDDEEKAEQMFVKLLLVDKEHQLSAEDPAELYLLREKFKTEPIFRVAFRAGANKSMPTVLQEFNTSQTSKRYNENGNDTGLGVGFWAEATAERHIKKGFEVAAGIQYRIATYEVEGDLLPLGLNYVAKNTNNMLRIPVLGRYNLNYDKKTEDGKRVGILPYVFIGASYDLTVSAKYLDTRRTGGTAYTLPDESSDLKERNQVATSNLSLIAGLGMKARIGRAKVDFLSLELRYDNTLFNYIDAQNRYTNRDVNWGIGHVEDDLTINAISFSIGYVKSIYLPRKRKQFR